MNIDINRVAHPNAMIQMLEDAKRENPANTERVRLIDDELEIMRALAAMRKKKSGEFSSG